MYEENSCPLPSGDAAAIFAETLAEIERRTPTSLRCAVVPDSGWQQANTAAQPYFAGLCRRLLLPGSGIVGFENLASLVRLAQQGAACLLCLNHRSTLDVPTLYALIEDQGDLAVFHRIIWISGRKLDEDCGATPLLARCFHRITVTPKATLREIHDATQRSQSQRMNRHAYRAMHGVRNTGWVLAFFPAGTRLRPADASTGQAIEETDSYLRRSDYLVLGHIDGCTLPVSRDRDLSHEIPRLDRMIYTFSPVMEAGRWRSIAAARYPALDQRRASMRAIMEDIAALHA
jgi:hypothetical protein